MTPPPWPGAPNPFPQAGVDFDRANAARIYDFLLGGAHNFAVDRDQAATILAGEPDMARVCRAQRTYLARTVTWCLRRAGIDQFLDLGCGVPTVGNVHEVAHAIDPSARVAYVDFEPVAVTHARELVADLSTVTVTAADLRDAQSVLTAPGVTGLLDFTRPVAVLTVGVLHFVPGDLGDILAPYRAVLAPGSALVLSHGSEDWEDPGMAAAGRAAGDGYDGSATPATLRTRTDILEALRGLDLVPPGLVDMTAWPDPEQRHRPDVTRTDPSADRPLDGTHTYAALARVTAPPATGGRPGTTPRSPRGSDPWSRG